MDGYSYSAKANTGVCIAMLILTAAAVAIRLLIRFEQRQGLLLSDWLAIIATVFHDAYCIVILHCEPNPFIEVFNHVQLTI